MIDRSGSRIDHLNIAVPDLDTAVAFYEPIWRRSASPRCWRSRPTAARISRP